MYKRGSPKVDKPADTSFKEAFKPARKMLLPLVVFSCSINILMLTGPMFMLQVYDRVLSSRSVSTLVALVILAVILYSFMGLLEWFRTQMLGSFSLRADIILRGLVFKSVLVATLMQRDSTATQRPINDLGALSAFLSGIGPAALLDVPWVIIFLFFLTLLHPVFLVIGIFSALVLLVVAFAQDRVTKDRIKRSSRALAASEMFSFSVRRDAETVKAMGITQSLTESWLNKHSESMVINEQIKRLSTSLSQFSKIFRMFMQSFTLGTGAYLAIYGLATPGVMIAASILLSRCLAPIEMSIASWRQFTAARQGYERLKMLENPFDYKPEVSLPKPSKSVSFQNVHIFPPGVNMPVLKNINFSLKAGDTLGVVGSSASGKSSLARAMVGIWRPRQGRITLDSSDMYQWGFDGAGSFIGYLPQSVELLEGTIAENISRFDENPLSEDILQAARSAGIDEMIRKMPLGYSTSVGVSGESLSGGQKQRIGLARAMYGNPFLLVLDEPNSNLDSDGDIALRDAIISSSKRGQIVVVMAHRPSAIAAVDNLMVLEDGWMKMMGKKDAVLNVLNGSVKGQKVDSVSSGRTSGR